MTKNTLRAASFYALTTTALLLGICDDASARGFSSRGGCRSSMGRSSVSRSTRASAPKAAAAPSRPAHHGEVLPPVSHHTSHASSTPSAPAPSGPGFGTMLMANVAGNMVGNALTGGTSSVVAAEPQSSPKAVVEEKKDAQKKEEITQDRPLVQK